MANLASYYIGSSGSGNSHHSLPQRRPLQSRYFLPFGMANGIQPKQSILVQSNVPPADHKFREGSLPLRRGSFRLPPFEVAFMVFSARHQS